jgi:hypothetical protein
MVDISNDAGHARRKFIFAGFSAVENRDVMPCGNGFTDRG